MDPRHPEQAISRMRELIHHYDSIECDMRHATTSAQLAQLEREGGLVVQEICLVAPRIHEAMMQTSRQRRHDLAKGVLAEPQDTAVETPQGGMFEPEIMEEPVVIEKLVETELDKEVNEVLNPLEEPKKKTTKKKTTKKAKK